MLIIGLGNPGDKYKDTRHNVGFQVVENLQEKLDFPSFNFEKKFNAEISLGKKSVGFLRSHKIILVKPQTFMNLSGKAVASLLNFYKLTPKEILVIHDDIDLPFGDYRVSADSSAGGHNGVQGIIDKIGTQEFKRFRIGVSNPDLRTKINPRDFVLQKFSSEEKEKMETLLEKISEEIEKNL